MCRNCTGKSIGSSRSIHLLLGNRSAHAVEAYRKSGEARRPNRSHHLPAPFKGDDGTCIYSHHSKVVVNDQDHTIWVTQQLCRPLPISSGHLCSNSIVDCYFGYTYDKHRLHSSTLLYSTLITVSNTSQNTTSTYNNNNPLLLGFYVLCNRTANR